MTDARRRAGDAAFVVGGALLALSALLHWVSRGNGSTLRGHALMDAIESLSHGRSSAPVTLLTVLWYAVPACGALAWIVVGFGDPRGPSGRATAVAALAVTAAVDTYFWVKVGTRAGPGVYVAAAGAIALALGTVVARFADGSTKTGTTGDQVRGTSRSS